MKTIWMQEIDAILAKGIWLGNIGVNNWALSRESALTVLGELHEMGVTVLGGDVYASTGKVLGPTRDNWYFEPSSMSCEETTLEASIAKSKNYINNYHSDTKEVYFALIPKCAD